MTGRDSLARFLSPDASDVGCGATFAALDSYVERELTHLDAQLRYPAIAAHLRACDPCAEDFRGLLAAARASA